MFDKAVDAIRAAGKDRRVYQVTGGHGVKYVAAVSPAQAALEYIGKHRVILLGMREQNAAMIEELCEQSQESREASDRETLVGAPDGKIVPVDDHAGDLQDRAEAAGAPDALDY